MLLTIPQFHGKAFKIALLDQWTVVVSGPKMVDELRKRPDEELSFIEGTEEVRSLRLLVMPHILTPAPSFCK